MMGNKHTMSGTGANVSGELVTRSPVWLLGRGYPMDSLGHQDAALQPLYDDFVSRFWFTYRRGFSSDAIPPFTSDGGWGCMMRSGQMLLGHVLMTIEKGREWRLDRKGDESRQSEHRQILRLFDDVLESPYSLPNIAIEGELRHQMALGEWIGPTTMCFIIRDLVARYQPAKLQVLVCSDSSIYRQQSIEAATSTGEWVPLLLLLPLRLGLDNINPMYKPALLRTFAIRQSCGVIGGKPSASLYFIAAQDENVWYLDPHTVQDRVNMRGAFDTSSFHCKQMLQMKVDRLDPCLAVAFLCTHRDDFEQLCEKLSEIEEALGSDGRSIISIQECTPQYDEDAIAMMMGSDEEDDDFVLM